MNLSLESVFYSPRKKLFFQIGLVILGLINSVYSHGQSALLLNGNETHIRIEADPALALNEFTIECWLMITGEGTAIRSSAGNEYSVPLVTRGVEEDETGSFINFYFGLRKADNILTAEIESAQTEEVPGYNYFIHGYTQLKKGEWYHVALTFDLHNLSMYLNGNLEASMEAPYSPASGSNSDIGIGTAFRSNGSGSGQFIGAFDEIRIWNRALSMEEIIAEMNFPKELVTENLVLQLGLNEGSGADLEYLAWQSHNISLEGVDYEWNNGAHFNALHAPIYNTDPVLRIGLMADPQYCDCDISGTRFYRETLWKLPDAIEGFNQEDVDFVVTLGDVIDKYPESYDSVLHFYDALNMPNFKVLGNHEFSDIPDLMKDSIIKLLSIPHYYYDTVYSSYRFIFIDGTEMGEYTRSIHPEIADEADSIWNAIQGEPKAKIWNGGIGRTQRNWIESRIKLATVLGQSVILMGHHQIYPDSTRGNMWNDVQMTELFERYPNVLAYINGHNHWGEKGLKKGIQYFTHKGMVESGTTSAYSVLEIYPHKFEFLGFGAQESMVLKVRKQDSVQTIINVNSPGISYKTDSGDFAGIIGNQDTLMLNYFLVPASSINDNEYFTLETDSLKLLQHTLPPHKSEFKVEIKALTCGFDTIENEIELSFDTLAIDQIQKLSDTSLYKESNYFIELDSVIFDRSEFGLSFQTASSNSAILESYIHNDTLFLFPKNIGQSFVSYEAFDPFSEQRISDTMHVRIVDTINTEPVAVHSSDTLLMQISEASMYVPWDSVFFDLDDDSLQMQLEFNCEEVAEINVGDLGFTIRSLGSGICSISAQANDQRGGEVQTGITLRVNSPPEVLVQIEDTSLLMGNEITYHLDTYFADDELLQFQIKTENAIVETNLNGEELMLQTKDSGQCKLFVQANDSYGASDSIAWIVTVKDTSSVPVFIVNKFASESAILSVSPVPVVSEASIQYSLVRNQYIELCLYAIDGKKTKIFYKGIQVAGFYSVNLDATQLKTGIYLLRLITESGSITQKILVEE